MNDNPATKATHENGLKHKDMVARSELRPSDDCPKVLELLAALGTICYAAFMPLATNHTGRCKLAFLGHQASTCTNTRDSMVEW